ncbi:hypothetical protein FHS85_000946 [Rhodoligotrophos appendicifer]|uniref:sulfotransferase domain-containing protein n=1 Tax=Rhodoligotrophos appendicifer TaxID=987056 RepID=UPI00117EFD2F|nr:sulfotransferase domain-containing protein [Rhodoligotrophos appendicifer]
MGALPNLIVIGGMKCGTTSFHAYFDRHPAIGMSNPKEVNFFAGENAHRGVDWYQSLFDGTKPVRGESSQNYSKAHHPLYAGAPKRIHDLVPECKLIYLVRDPIERYLSHLVESYIGNDQHKIQWAQANDHYVKTSLYYYQLSYFLDYFPLSQILVLDVARIRRDRLSAMNQAFDFLGVERFTEATAFDFVVNENGEDIVPNHMRRHPAYRVANRLAPRMTDRLLKTPLLRNALFPGSLKKKLTEEEHARLANRFRPDVEHLRKLTGQSFSAWSL